MTPAQEQLYRLRLRQTHTHELRRRYERLADLPCAETTEAELGRQFAMQEISDVLSERNAL